MKAFLSLCLLLIASFGWAQSSSWEFEHYCTEEEGNNVRVIVTTEFPYGNEWNMPEFSGYEFVTPDEGWNTLTITYDYYGNYAFDGASRTDTITIPYDIETCFGQLYVNMYYIITDITSPIESENYAWCGIAVGVPEQEKKEQSELVFWTITGIKTDYQSYVELPSGMYIVIEDGVAKKIMVR